MKTHASSQCPYLRDYHLSYAQIIKKVKENAGLQIELKDSDFLELENMAKVGDKIAKKIEEALYAATQEEINREYGKRFRDLQSALKNEENVRMRLGVLTGDTAPEEFVKF